MSNPFERKLADNEQPDVTETCKKCGSSHPYTSEFFKTMAYKDGRILRRFCRVCQRKSARGHYGKKPELRVKHTLNSIDKKVPGRAERRELCHRLYMSCTPEEKAILRGHPLFQAFD